mgnify:CR=1 FL=1
MYFFIPVVCISVFLKIEFLQNSKNLFVVCITRIMVKALTHVIGNDLWYRNRCMELTRTHGIDMDSWYRHGLMV